MDFFLFYCDISFLLFFGFSLIVSYWSIVCIFHASNLVYYIISFGRRLYESSPVWEIQQHQPPTVDSSLFAFKRKNRCMYRNNQRCSHVSQFSIVREYHETWDTFNFGNTDKKFNETRNQRTKPQAENNKNNDRKVVYKIACVGTKWWLYSRLDWVLYSLYHRMCSQAHVFVCVHMCVCVFVQLISLLLSVLVYAVNVYV